MIIISMNAMFLISSSGIAFAVECNFLGCFIYVTIITVKYNILNCVENNILSLSNCKNHNCFENEVIPVECNSINYVENNITVTIKCNNLNCLK